LKASGLMHERSITEAFMRSFLLVAVGSFLLFALGGMFVWHQFYEPDAPKDLVRYEEQMRNFDTCVVGIWVVFLVVIWKISRLLRKAEPGPSEAGGKGQHGG
jgi:hypothetical protein